MAKPAHPNRYLLCVSSLGVEVSLDVWKVYRQLPDDWAESHEMVRVIDNTGEDYLFPASHFMPIQIEPAMERRIRSSVRKQTKRVSSTAG
jgi:hypothetical protein